MTNQASRVTVKRVTRREKPFANRIHDDRPSSNTLKLSKLSNSNNNDKLKIDKGLERVTKEDEPMTSEPTKRVQLPRPSRKHGWDTGLGTLGHVCRAVTRATPGAGSARCEREGWGAGGGFSRSCSAVTVQSARQTGSPRTGPPVSLLLY